MELDVQLDSLGLYDIYGLYHVSFWQTTWFYYSVILFCTLFVLSFIAFFLYRFWKRRSKRLLTPWEKALRDLDFLEKQKLINQSQCDKFYERITHIVRVYLAERFAFDVLSKTDDEMCGYIQKSDNTAFKVFKDVFNAGTMAKFAQSSFVQERLEQDYACIKKFVQNSIPEDSK